MHSTTLKDYKDNYQTSLEAFLAEYEDNTELFFLENELVKFQDYHNALIVFKKDLFFSKNEKTVTLAKHSGITKILKNNNLKVFNDIVTEIIDSNGDPKLSAYNDFISVDTVKLQNYINSSIRIFDFINSKMKNIINEIRSISFQDRPSKEFPKSNLKVSNLKEKSNTNDLLTSTIEDYLEEFKENINGNGYLKLVDALFGYFTNGVFPILDEKIKFKRINKKRIGWALKELYKSERTDNLDIEYFRFAQENINLFEKEIIETTDFNKSKFYKMFTTNPAK